MTKIEDAELKISELEEELLKEKDRFLRVAAEYDNYRKRTDRDKLNIYHDAVFSVIKEIMPVLDSLNIAVASQKGENEDYQKGLELVVNQFNSALERLSVESFGEVGDKFDPQYHNAIAHTEDKDFGENEIVEVFSIGYKIFDKVIRHAMVKVAN